MVFINSIDFAVIHLYVENQHNSDTGGCDPTGSNLSLIPAVFGTQRQAERIEVRPHLQKVLAQSSKQIRCRTKQYQSVSSSKLSEIQSCHATHPC